MCVAPPRQFSMPVEVRWGIFDGSLLRRYWSQRVDQRSRAADITDKILVFHRGEALACQTFAQEAMPWQ